ncbi:MAG: SusC/RagA family TonB-linked outer membrane protein [Prevotella sp.]|nr:SusC/RagA family TonB-linked outer membrane protein [Prevotella sp.]
MEKFLSLKKPMSVVIAIFMLCCVSLNMNAQTASKLITCKCKNMKLSDALRDIERMSGYYRVQFTYSDVNGMTVTSDVTGLTAPDAVRLLLEGKPLECTVQGQFIYINKVAQANNADKGGSKTVFGVVTDQDDEPLFGASVRIKGSSTGTTTNSEGKFQLRVNSENDILQINFIGMEPYQVSVKGKNQINAKMHSASSELDEVTVVSTGYQRLSRERVTGSFGFVDSTRLNSQNFQNLEAALEGQVAGLHINHVSDGTSNAPIIRGVGTLSVDVGTQPLLVIDDMPTEMSLNDINPYDVESITVLKDAAASSIYGARAANGVIVVTTKNAKSPGTTIAVNADWFITEQQKLDALHLMNTSQIIDQQTAVYNSYIANAGSTEGYFDARGTSYYSPLYQLYRDQAAGKISQQQVESTLAQWRSNDYYDEFMRLAWRTPVTQRYNVNLSQRAGKSAHTLSFNYSNSKGQSISDKGSNNWSTYFRSVYKVNKWLTASVGLNASFSASSSSQSYGYSSQERYLRILDDNGNRITYPNGNQGGYAGSAVNLNVIENLAHADKYKPFTFNVLDQMEESITKNRGVSLRPYASVDAKFLKWFNYTLSYQYEWSMSKSQTFDEENSYRMRMTHNAMIDTNGNSLLPEGGRFYQKETSRNNYTLRNQLGFEKAWTDHRLNAIMGLEFRQNKVPRDLEQVMYGYHPVTLKSQNIDAESLSTTGWTSELYGRNTTLSTLNTTQYITRHRYASFYANAGYTLMNRYNLTGSIRWDEADMFGLKTNEQKHPLWSVGAGWTISQEDFMKNLSWLDYLKYRITYGINGNVDQTSSTFFVATYSKQTNPITTTYLKYSDNNLPNPHLRWEKTATFNTGFDFRILNNVLGGSIEYYNRHATDLLVERSLDPTTGVSARKINNGEMSNRGIELSLNANIVRTKDWHVGANLTFALNRNKIIDVDVDENTLASNYVLSPQNYFILGESYNTVWAYKLDRIQNGYPVIKDAEGNDMVEFDENGDVKSVTQTSTLKGVESLKKCGTLTPKWNGGLSVNIKWRDMELNAMMVYSGGNKMRTPTPSLTEGGGNTTDDLDSWNGTSGIRQYKDMSTTARQYAGIFDNWLAYSDAYVKSANFCKLRNINLTYSLPQRFCKVIGIHSLRLRLQANNLLTWSAVGDDIDPETYGLNGGSRAIRTPRSYSIGLSTSF